MSEATTRRAALGTLLAVGAIGVAPIAAGAATADPVGGRAQAELQALAADFEVALEALRPFFYGSGSDDDADAATDLLREISQKIVAIPTTDIEMMRLKARIYLWSEAKEFETFAAESKDGDWSGEALVSLFRDLGADHLFRSSGLGHRPARRSSPLMESAYERPDNR